VPSPAARGSDATIVQGRCKATQIADTRGSNRLDDRQDIGGERRCFRDLHTTATSGGFSWIVWIPQPGALGLALRERRSRAL